MSFSEFYDGVAGIGQAYTAGADEFAKKTALSRLGQQVKSGNYSDAAQTAFDAGDAGTGLSLLKLGEAHRTQQLQEKAGTWFDDGLSRFGSGGDGASGGGSALSSLGGGTGASQAPRSPSFSDASGPAGDYLAGLTKREANGNQYAKNPNSSATGLGQFTDGTWGDLMRRRPDLGLTANGRTDPDQAMRATAAFTEENEGILSRAGLPVNAATKYAVHFLGQSGGPAFIARSMQNPDAPAAALARPEQVAANRGVFYNRDGSPKSARQVFADFDRSFGGGGGGGQPVAYADNEAQTAGANEADMPAVGARETAFYIPGSDPARPSSSVPPQQRQPIPSSETASPGFTPDAAGRRAPPSSAFGHPALPLPPPAQPETRGGVPAGGSSSRVMTLPGDPSASQAGQAPGDAAPAQVQTIGSTPVAQIASMGKTQQVQFLVRAASHPYLPDSQRQVAMEMLKRSLDETKLPDEVKEYQLARAQGFGGTLLDYKRELKRPGGPTLLSPGQSVYDEGSNSIRITAPDRSRSNVSDDVQARRDAAGELGLSPGSPAYQSYVLTGKMPREDAQPLTAGDKKAIQDADTAVLSAQNVIDALGQAKQLSKQAYSGVGAGPRGYVTSMFGNEAGIATSDLDNLVTTQALGQLRQIFGGNPTEGERAILLQIQGSSSQPDAVRQRIYDRAMGLANLRLQQNQEKAAELRGQTYYRPGSGPQAGQRGAGNAAPALPAPSQTNRPGVGRPAGPASGVPNGAVDYLRQNPALSGAFDEKYGAGAAARALGGQ